MLSSQAEEAIFALNFVKAIKIQVPRRAPRMKSIARAQRRLQTEMQISRVVGIAENYLMMRAVAVRRPDLLLPVAMTYPIDPITKKLRDARQRFDIMAKLWKEEIGVDLAGLPVWPRFELARILRHVLVHRLGEWQPALDPKPRLNDRILQVSANPDLYRGPVPLDETDLDEALDVTLLMIAQLDVRPIRTTESTVRATP